MDDLVAHPFVYSGPHRRHDDDWNAALASPLAPLSEPIATSSVGASPNAMARSSSDSSSHSSTESLSLSLSSFPLTPTSSFGPPSIKEGFVFNPTTSTTAAHLPRTSFTPSSTDRHVSPRPSFSSGSSPNPYPPSPSSSSTSRRSRPDPASLLSPALDPFASFMSASVVDAADDEESCPICLELLSLRLAGEKPHVVPICGHRLHHSCFEAVYGDVERAKSKSGGSSGLCGVCRRDMRIGDSGESARKGNKFAKLSGLPPPSDEGPSAVKMRSRSMGTLEIDPAQQDDDLVQLASPTTSVSHLHPHYQLNRQSQSSGTGSTVTSSSMDTFRGPGSTGSGGSIRSATGVVDIVKPVVTVRAEHASVERSLDRDKKQHLTCMVTIEMPSRWPTAPPNFDAPQFADSPSLPLPPPPPSSSNLARSTSSIRSGPLAGSLNRSSVYSAYAFGSTKSAAPPQFASVVEDLQKRMADWKGHSPDEFGQLKLYDYLNVRKETASREFLVYLFEEAILCVASDKRKGLGKLADAMTGNSDKLRLKGRVYVRHIRSVADTSKDDDLSLTITMNDDAVAEFVMLFKERTSLEVWKAQIEYLLVGHSLPLPPPPPEASARKLSVPGDTMSESSSIPSLALSSGGFSGLSLSTASSLPPHSSAQSEEVDGTDRSHPGFATSSSPSHSLASSPSSHTLGSIPSTPVSLGPRLFTGLDLVLILSVPAAGPTSLKIGIIRNSLEFLIAHVGPRTRLSLVTYTSGEGSNGVLRKTPFIAVGKPDGRARLEKAVREIGTQRNDSTAMIDHPEERVNVVTACNVALDIVLQRRTKSALTGMILLNDGRDGTQKQQMDLVMARAEAASVPIHAIGYGKSHDPSSLWLLSNHSGGSYTFVENFYDLRDALAGTVGGILSIAATNVRLHIHVPEQRWFKIRKVSGTAGAIVARTGADVDVEVGELRFGERKDLIVEVELSLSGYGEAQARNNGLPEPQDFSATDAFFLAQAGINPSSLEDYNLNTLCDDEYEAMPDEVPLFEVNAAYRDPAAGKSISRLNQHPCLLTITINPPSAGPRPPQPLASAPEIVCRRMEILVSDLLSRALLLQTRRNDSQAARLLEETKRIISTISSTLGSPPSPRGPARRSISQLNATARTQRTLAALMQDVEAAQEACRNRALFESVSRYQAAQQAVVLRDQRAWTSKSPTERLFWTADNSVWMVAKSQQWLSPVS
ncbi:hypothetical protein JCM10212_006985 [Sporobolomyces blumeae]